MSKPNAGRDQIRQAMKADRYDRYKQPPPPPVCRWTYDELTDAWDTGCGRKWQFTTGGPRDNHVRFCHQCGASVKVDRS
jgi:hypothetical protein